MKDKKKVFLRILKEVGRLLLVVILPFLFVGIFGGVCINNLSPHSHLGSCFEHSRIIVLTCPIVMMFILFPFIYHGKLSKLWIIEWACFFLFILFAGYIVDYVTRVEPKQSSIKIEDTLEEYEEMRVRGVK